MCLCTNWLRAKLLLSLTWSSPSSLSSSSVTYLGTSISPLPISDQVKKHLSSKSNHVLKFCSFLTKNSDAPFQVKRTVWESDLQSPIFYGIAMWLTTDLRVAESTWFKHILLLIGQQLQYCCPIGMPCVWSPVYAPRGHTQEISHRAAASDRRCSITPYLF